MPYKDAFFLDFRFVTHYSDVYAKVEFRQHKDANEKFIPGFISAWEAYCENLEADAAKSGQKADFGRAISVDLLENDLSADQQVQEMGGNSSN